MQQTLTDKKVIVLGGTSGLGLATAQAAAVRGARVVVVSGNASKVEAALNVLADDAEGHALDLSRESNIAAFFDGIGPFDHLVYTAGETLTLEWIKDMDLARARDFYTLRYWGALAAVKYAAPHIRTGGSIGLTGGIASPRPGKGWALAASICGAMEGLTRALAVELAPLRVNLVAPGVVRTPLWSGIPEKDRERFYAETAARLPVGRVGEAEDIARSFAYLMEQSYVTGQVLVVDGGTVLV
jgi:NAD(P)-dependent dehydrogenase (short-subunit alcohol dehydrogenase family)